MKKEKLEEKVELAKIISRAIWVVPYIAVVCAGAIISEQTKKIYYNLFKIPYTTFERNDFVSYIRTDKSVSQE